ncbi:hypothetical protein Tco_1338268 [Tanacetum coccineum]
MASFVSTMPLVKLVGKRYAKEEKKKELQKEQADSSLKEIAIGQIPLSSEDSLIRNVDSTSTDEDSFSSNDVSKFLYLIVNPFSLMLYGSFSTFLFIPDIPTYLSPGGDEDTIFDPAFQKYHSSKQDVFSEWNFS